MGILSNASITLNETENKTKNQNNQTTDRPNEPTNEINERRLDETEEFAFHYVNICIDVFPCVFPHLICRAVVLLLLLPLLLLRCYCCLRSIRWVNVCVSVDFVFNVHKGQAVRG